MAPAFIQGTDETSALMRGHDWSASPLGCPTTWPQSLRSVVGLMLDSKFPMFVAWGPELGFLYNESYAELLGAKHPAALGRRFHDVWAEIWPDISPLIDRALAGEATYYEDLPLTVRRKGHDEQAWFTFSYSPVRDEAGRVAGMFCAVNETTEKVLAERRLAAESEGLRRLFHQAPGFMCVLRGREHVFELANAAYLKLVGHRDLVGTTVRDAMPELEGQGFFELLDNAFATGEAFVGRRRPIALQRSPGGLVEERFVDFVHQPIRDADGRVTGIFHEGIDVTERVSRAQAGREAERRMVQLADGLPQLAWIADGAGRAVWFNQRFQDYTGLEQGALLARDWQGLLPDGERAVVAARWREALDGGHPFVATVRLARSGGELRTFFATAVPIEGSGGAIEQWFGTCTDVSSLQETQEALRVTQEWLQQGLSTGKMVVWDFYPDSGQIRYSDNAGEVLGYAHDHIENSFRHVHADDMPGLRDAMRRTIEDGEHYHHTSRRINPASGQVKWIEQRGRVVSNPGEPTRMIGVNIDVTERVLAEQQLQEASRRKDEFLAMLAHELRNPLAPISSSAALLNIQFRDEPRIRQASSIISRQVKHMSRLIDDLLDVSRVTRGLVTLQVSEVDLGEVIRSALDQTRPLVEEKSHRVELQLPPQPVTVQGDATRLIQSVANILNNAAKYTPPAGTIRVVLEVLEVLEVQEVQDGVNPEGQGRRARIRVHDNGCGMPSELLPSVFELFTQGARTLARSQGGLGLGLALVRKLVELHGGTVAAHSEGVGKGSVFTIELPCTGADGAGPGRPGQAGQHGQSSNSAASAYRPLRLIIVDDNEDAADSLATLLRAQGHTVLVEYSAGAALRRAGAERPDAMVVDIGLPDMDGYQLAALLRKGAATRYAVLIAATGYGGDSDRERARAAGFAHHLVKPVDVAALLRILRAVASAPG